MNNRDTAKVIEILLVEDNLGDARLAQEGLGEGKASNRLNAVSDGEGAIARLRAWGEYKNVHRSDMVLLDLTTPVDLDRLIKPVKAMDGLAISTVKHQVV
jgi:two-component system, chemotaxis family, response regulator Rcp1